MSADRRRRLIRAGLLAPLLLAGCIERTMNNGLATYRFAWWAMAAMAAGGAISIFSARFVPTRTDGWYRFTRKIRWGLISIGVVAMFLPVIMYSNTVTISDQGFTENGGFFGENVHRVTFDDLKRVEFVAETSGIGRSRRTNYYFICFGKDGTSHRVPVSGSCMQAALPEIVEALRASRVPIIDKAPRE